MQEVAKSTDQASVARWACCYTECYALSICYTHELYMSTPDVYCYISSIHYNFKIQHLLSTSSTTML